MKVKPYKNGDGIVVGHTIYCPGCKYSHTFFTNKDVIGHVWTFNDSKDKPTFSPSMLIRGGHYAENHKPGDRCWCSYNEEHPGEEAPFVCAVCHSFVRNGQIQFLDDCTHDLKGQTVDLPNWEDMK